MKRVFFRGIALAGIFTAVLGLAPLAAAQSIYRIAEPSFAPRAGILGAIPNLAAYGLTRVAVVNGVPLPEIAMRPGPAPIAGPLSKVTLNQGSSGGLMSRQAQCKGFARASDGSLVATTGTGLESVILGADCDALINATLDAGHGLVFSASVLFAGSSDTISLPASRALKMTAQAINLSGGLYEVSGYASSEGDRIANDYLSLARAKAASYFLIKHGVKTSSLNVVGKGATTIFGPELAVNRRVVVRRKT